MNNKIKYIDSDPSSEYGHIQSNKFNINPKANKRLWVVDDFFEDPLAVRKHALNQYYHDDDGYLGTRTRKQWFFDGMKEKFEETLGKKITKWEGYGMNGRFQSCIAGTKLVYHCDSQSYAAAIYLTPYAPYWTGTSFWAYKAYNPGDLGSAYAIRHNSHPDLNVAFPIGKQTFVDKSPYDLVDVVGNVFNRLVIWDAGWLGC